MTVLQHTRWNISHWYLNLNYYRSPTSNISECTYQYISPKSSVLLCFTVTAFINFGFYNTMYILRINFSSADVTFPFLVLLIPRFHQLSSISEELRRNLDNGRTDGRDDRRCAMAWASSLNELKSICYK